MNPRETTLQKASALFDSGKRDEAVALLRRALTKEPGDLLTCQVLCGMLLAMGAGDQAQFVASRTVQLRVKDPYAVLNEGSVLARSGKAEAAVAAAERARDLAPGDVRVQREVSAVLAQAGRRDLALAHARALWSSHHGDRTALAALIEHLLPCAEFEEAYVAVQVVADAGGLDVDLASWQCLHANYLQGRSAEEVLAVHMRAGQLMTAAAGGGPAEWGLKREPERRLRVAYVSQDFRNRSAAHFFEPILRAHDRDRVEPYLYYAMDDADGMTEALRRLSAVFRQVPYAGHSELADLMRSDRIDIAVDLTGHTGGNRLLAFAHRPAPVMINYMGYANTTGLEAMRYRLVDAITDPEGSDRWATEELVRLAPCFLCYAAPAHAPEVSARPGVGPVTFGSFNTMGKITVAVLELWARVLHATPGSRLFMKNMHFGMEATRERVRATLGGLGIDKARLELSGEVPEKDEHLRAYGRVDIALDPFPYNGTTTTVEAMLMGVPVVTLLGDSHRARVSSSLLSVVGHPELIAKDADEYVRIATGLAADRTRLAGLRSSLRAELLSSPLCDGPGFTRRLEGVYRDLWKRWCAAT